MSRALVILGVLIALVASELAPAAGTPEPAAAAPSLRLLHVQPFTLAGKGFKPREHLRVTVAHEEQTFARVLNASRLGNFVVNFAELKLRRCAPLFVRASGVRGSRAILKLAPPACVTD